MIISASRRTDIPAFYSEWMMMRLREKSVIVVNPFNRSQSKCISLSPDDVDCIVFWTKDVEPMLHCLDELDNMGHNYIFQFTITPYGNDIEKNLRHKSLIADDFLRLSEHIGSNRVLWRYDPIIINDVLTIEYHKEHFGRLCEKLYGATEQVTISFVDIYPKLNKYSHIIREITIDEMRELCSFCSAEAKAHKMRTVACCEKHDFSAYGVEQANCIDKYIIEHAIGYSLELKRDRNQRPGCGCYASTDIGAYNTCGNGCIYCYACKSNSTVKYDNINSLYL